VEHGPSKFWLRLGVATHYDPSDESRPSKLRGLLVLPVKKFLSIANKGSRCYTMIKIGREVTFGLPATVRSRWLSRI